MGKIITDKYGKESTCDIVIPDDGELTLSEEMFDLLLADPSYDDQLPESLVATLTMKREALTIKPDAEPDEKEEKKAPVAEDDDE
jgi:hypothetical protein